MRLLMFQKNITTGIGVEKDGRLYGITADQDNYPGDLDSLLAAGADLEHIASTIFAEKGQGLDPEQIIFLPPVARPGKIICVGLNYASHSDEFGLDTPPYPELFSRFASTLVGHQQPIIKPSVSDNLDYEGELAVVIGKSGRHIPQSAVCEHIAAYSIFNDASIRDYQFRGSQWLPGKNFDNTGAFGPWLITADELSPDTDSLRIQTRLNGVIVQDGNTSDMIFKISVQIAMISEIMTLNPGDVIVTGTPGGVGYSRKPQLFMQPGDICEIEIEGVGTLRNPISLER